MGFRRRWACLAAWLLIAASGGLVACSSARLEPGALDARQRLVVAPLNLAVKLDEKLGDGVQPVRDEIIAYLQQRHAKVAVVWPSDAWDVWQLAMFETRDVSGGADRRLDKAVRRFLKELGREVEFGAFMLPTLVFRQAKVWGDTVRWDGVRRRLGTRSRMQAGVLPTVAPSIGESHVAGAKVPGVSLHVLVYNASGRRIFEGRGGLDLAHAVLVTGVGDSGHGKLVSQENPFQNLDHLKEGVALALDAYSPSRSR